METAAATAAAQLRVHASALRRPAPAVTHAPLRWPSANTRPSYQQGGCQHHPPVCSATDHAAAATDGLQPAQPPASADGTPSVQQLKAACHDAAAFAAALERLTERGSGGGATEAHVVAAWAAQRRSPALHPVPGSAQEADALRALVALEELTRRHLVALTPDQLGYVFRCYVLAGGESRPLLQRLQQTACSWRALDFSAAGLAELAWALASSSEPVSDGCRQLLHAALQEKHIDGCQQGQQEQQQVQAQQQQPSMGLPQQEHHAQQQQQQVPPRTPPLRHWSVWFEGAPASKVALLLWAAGRLGCRPCKACTQAAAAALLRPGAGLASLPTKSLGTLLWALATLRAEQHTALARAVTQALGDRLESALGWEQGEALPPAGAQGEVVMPRSSAAGGLSFGDDSGGSVLGSGPGGGSTEEEEEEEAVLGGAATPAPMPHVGSTSFGEERQSGAGGTGTGSSSSWWQAGRQDFPTGMLSTVVWACGRLRHGDPRLLQAAAALLQEQVEEMSPGDVARVLWGLAQLGHCPAPLLSAVAAHLQAPGVLPEFGVRQLAMTTHAFVALDFFPGQGCVDLVADACLAARHAFGGEPRALSNVLWNMSRLGHVDELFYLAFVPVILPSIERYGPSELADVARVYSRNGLNPGDERGGGGTLFDALARQTVDRIQGADLQDVLRIMTAFHQMGLQPEELLAAVEGWANQRLQKLSPQALSLALWSFARMGTSSRKLLETAAACAEQQLAAFTPAQLAKVAWSLAKLRWPAPRVLRHAGAQLAERTAAFNDKEASNVLWALASEGEALPGEALDRIAANLAPRLKSFGPQSLANIAWAYATLGHHPAAPHFLRQLAHAAQRCLPVFEPQGLSLLVWSLASLDCRQAELLGKIVSLCCDQPSLLRQFEGQHLANLVWGMCRVGYCPAQRFLEAVALEVQLRVCDLKPQELFNIVWAFAQLGYHPACLFDAVALEAAPQAVSFSPQELSGMLWALAKAEHATRATGVLLEAVEHEVAARAARFEPRHLAIVAWSAGQLGHVVRPAALAALLGAVRPAALEARSLVPLVAGLAAMEQQRQRDERPQQRQRRQQQQQEAAPVEPAAGAAAGAQQPSRASSPLVPPQLLDGLVGRTRQLLPGLKPFEHGQLVYGFAVLGSPLARQVLLLSPDGPASGMLASAARHAPLPVVVGLLWAVARWGCYSSPGLPRIADRLRRTSPQYRLPRPALVMLGQALRSMPPREVLALALPSGMQRAALVAAAAAARRDAAEAAGGARVAIGGGGEEAEARGASRWSSFPEDDGRRRRALAAGAGPELGAVVQPPDDPADYEEGEVPLGATYEAEEDFQSL